MPRFLSFWICPLLLAAGLTMPATAQVDPLTPDIFAANQWLGKTLNVALTFEAPQEGQWGHMMQAEEFSLIKKAGFSAIRLAIAWSAHMDSLAPYTVDPVFLKRIDWAVQQSLGQGLAIVLDNHLDEALMQRPAENKARFLGLWSQLSAHYQKFPPQVMFEVMAEPWGKLSSLWNDYFAEALGIIRVLNPTRAVIVGPVFYNSPYQLNGLRLSETDQHLIVSFHLYTPIKFTMQGEAWFPYGKPMEWIGTPWKGTPEEQSEISKQMVAVAEWARVHHRPVFMGEFGCSDQADPESRVRYVRYNRQQAEANHFSWGYFNFTVRFSLYDQQAKAWRQPMLDALMGKDDATGADGK